LKGESPALDNFLAFEYDSLLRFFEIWSFNLAKKGGIESVKTKLLDIVKFIGIRLRWLNPELDISFLTAAILQDNKDIESARRAALDIFRAADSFISKSNQGYLSSQRQDASIAHRILRCIDLSA
jgi:hypothetical protein